MNLVKRVACAAGALLLFLSFAASAESYTYSYRYEDTGELLGPDPAFVQGCYSGDALGCGPLSSPQDMAVAPDGRLFIADTGHNRILVLDEQLSLLSVIDKFDNAGTEDTFCTPKGVYVTHDGTLYVADTDNGRIVILDKNFALVQIVENPQSDLFTDTFLFKPAKLAADDSGRLFVVAERVYDGLMEFDAQGNFVAYTGANKVVANLVEVIWKALSSQAQKEYFKSVVPTEFSNVAMDGDGFVYTVTRDVDKWSPEQSSPVRRQTATGEDILRTADNYPRPVGDLLFPYITEEATITGPSALVDVAVWGNGMYSVLDAQRGRVFTYDEEGYLYFIFGGNGDTAGSFTQPTALVNRDDHLLILDSQTGILTDYALSDYGRLIIKAQDAYSSGRYEEAGTYWRDCLKQNSNLEIAYIGLGKVLITQGQYKEAMEYLQVAGNSYYYSKAFKLYREEYLNRNIYPILAVAAVLAVALLVYHFKIRPILQQKKPLQRFEGWRGFSYGFHIITHPFDGFWDMTHERRGNLKAANACYALVALTQIVRGLYMPFMFGGVPRSEFNVVMTLLSVAVPAALWCLCNWCITTLFDGDGKPSAIVMATGYALLPYVLINLPVALLSNLLTLDEGIFVYVLYGFSLLWCVLLLFAGMLTIHQYTPGRTLLTILATIIGMALVAFMFLLLFNLVQQLYAFSLSVYQEIISRM